MARRDAPPAHTLAPSSKPRTPQTDSEVWGPGAGRGVLSATWLRDVRTVPENLEEVGNFNRDAHTAFRCGRSSPLRGRGRKFPCFLAAPRQSPGRGVRDEIPKSPQIACRSCRSQQEEKKTFPFYLMETA